MKKKIIYILIAIGLSITSIAQTPPSSATFLRKNEKNKQLKPWWFSSGMYLGGLSKNPNMQRALFQDSITGEIVYKYISTGGNSFDSTKTASMHGNNWYDGMYLGSKNNRSIIWRTNNLQRMTLDSNGRLKIQTSSGYSGNILSINAGGTSYFSLNTNGGSYANISEIRGGANSNLKFGTTDEGFSGYWDIAQNWDWNGKPGTWVFGTINTYPSFGNVATSGNGSHLLVRSYFKPTSGTSEYNSVGIVDHIYQTGGASGITRGIYINPTLTSAVNYRGIEIANVSGTAIYQSQYNTANYLLGNTGIGHGSSLTAKLHIRGSGTTSSSNGLWCENSSTSHLFSLKDDGQAFFGNSSDAENGKVHIVESNSSGAGLALSIANINTSGNSYAVLKMNAGSGGTKVTGQFSSDYTNQLMKVATFSNHPLVFQTNNTTRMTIAAAGNVNISNLCSFGGTGSTYPALTNNGKDIMVRLEDNSAYTNIRVKDSVYDYASWNGNNSVPTKNAVGDKIESLFFSGSAILDFPSTAAGTSSDLTITVSGATDGDPVSLGIANAVVLTNGCFTAWVSSSGIVTVRFTNNSSISSYDPPSGTYKVKVIK